MVELNDVGDPSQQWEEWSGYAYHVRRRLTTEEQEQVGEALDCRGTGEWAKRYYAISHKLPTVALALAQQEMVRR